MATCMYDPPGNFPGGFAKHVSPLTKTPAACETTCPAPDRVGYDFSGCPNKFPTACDPKCRIGYWARRPIFAQCLSTGQWHYDGECYANDCYTPNVPHWDFSGCLSTKYEGECDVVCKEGYVGNPMAACQANAQWYFTGSCTPANGTGMRN